ncbi:non-ribosomal peptide synthetase/type I polyketide synthase [Micromonospora echinofusca]|uniref:Amino acid adenylation domain-containing protein n=1 Tax=Micromonospora echinofusca TaxID=47858 RepID=A0ABS3VK69_MICEH|nr:non-ribosomal peptide synthetase/type I polyketide synthase [Micromonospora echinofusca]MBO4204876.1 amino acid adenylation domain-containing protein [Micromonospora echinofusca]
MNPAPSTRPPAVSRGAEPPTDPDLALTVDQALVRAAERFPTSGIHVVAADGQAVGLDYPTLLARGRGILAGLRARGVGRGDHVMLRISSGVEYFPALWGCLLGGIVPLTTAAPTSYDLDNPALDALGHAWRRLGGPVVVGGSDDLAGLSRSMVRDRVVPVGDLDTSDGGGGPAAADGEPAPDDVALLQLSSGSTGQPKIIQLTHRGLAGYATGARHMLHIGPDDVLLNWLPLDHIAGLLLYPLGGAFLGATSVHVATELVLPDPLRWLDLMESYRVTHSWAPNFGLRLVTDALVEAPDRRWDLGALRRMVSGGEQCLPATFADFVAATGLPAGVLTPAWGMSETATAITFDSYGASGCRQRIRAASLAGDLAWATDTDDPAGVVEFLSVGFPAPGTTLRIVDHDNRVLPEGRIGRLQLRSPRVTPGYLGDPEADRAAFPDGDWLATGDLAFMVDGRITVTGREKDLIILNGHNHLCHDIEQVAGAVSGVTDGLVAAFGVPDPETGSEALVVCYVPDGRAGVSGPPVDQAVRAAVARRWQVVPARVVTVGAAEFPRTTGGKIQRAALRERYLAGGFDEPTGAEPEAMSRPAPEPTPMPIPTAAPEPIPTSAPTAAPVPVSVSPDQPAARGPGAVRAAVADAVTAILGQPADPTVPFYELGIGSIGIVRLRARLEQDLGRRIDQPVLFAYPTVDALARHLTDPAVEPVPVAPTGRPGRDRRIAVIGMAARFPGAADVDGYWANLLAGVESIRHFTPQELLAAGLPPEQAHAPDLVAASGVLDDVAGFDADFFGISAREAELLDPQHRLFLEVCHHALEDAGYAGPTGGQRIGLYAGSGMNLYTHQTYLRHNLSGVVESGDPAGVIGAALGNQPDFLATRVAYRLGLTGPAIGVQTACSTSLVAVHLAVRALLDGDADVMLAGAAALHVPQVTGYRYAPGSILSRTGRCRPFDAAADGTVGGNGVAAVVLKRLDRALADGDPIHAVVLGTAVNNDGAGKVGFTAPSVAGQVDVIRRALRDADVPAGSVGYVEAHGTGTELGDPVEYHALREAYDGGRLLLGSVKANIGHLDSCAGMAGLLKTVLMVRTGRIPPQINFDRPNPAVDLTGGPFTVTTGPGDWPVGRFPRRAAVSALGVGGTNAHVIVEEPPAAARPVSPAPPPSAPGVLPLSAADPVALRELAGRYRDRLRADPHLRAADLVRTAGVGRRRLRHRLAVVGDSPAALADALDRFAAGTPDGPGGAAGPDLYTGDARGAGSAPVALAFPGQGDLRAALLDLAGRFPQVGAVLDRAATAYRAAVGGDLVAELHEPPGVDGRPTGIVQPALVAVGIGLAELWRSWGMHPDQVLGHSVGEYAALAVAGALSVEDAVWLAAHRGRLMQETMPPGAMLAVLADRATVDRLASGSGLVVAAVNGDRQHVLAGPPAAVDAVAEWAGRHGPPVRRLAVTRAFHSPAVEPVLDRFRALVDRVDRQPIRIPLVSSVDGRIREPGWRPDADHLCRQAREPVQWDAAVRTLAATGCRTVVEAGPDAVLTGIARSAGTGLHWVPSQQPARDPATGLWHAVARLYAAGVPLDWTALTDGYGGRRVPLPAYPFQHRPFWHVRKGPLLTHSVEEGPPVNTPPGVERPAGPAQQPATADPRGTGTVHEPTNGPRQQLGNEVVQQPGNEPTDGPVLARVCELTAERLGLLAASVDPDRSFFDLGADSLLLITMSREIHREFGVRVPVRELFGSVDTPRRLADAVTSARPADHASTARPADHASTARPSSNPVSTARPAQPSTEPVSSARPADQPSGVDPAGPGDPTRPAQPAPSVDLSPPIGTPAVALAGAAAGVPAPAPAELAGIIHRQLDLMQQQLTLLGTAGVAPAGPVPPDPAAGGPPAAAAPAADVGGTVRPVAAPARSAGRPDRSTDSGTDDATEQPTGRETGRRSGGTRQDDGVRQDDAGRQDSTDFSLYFFGDYPDQDNDDKYGVLLDAAQFADEHGFHAVWLPERHFHSFGGIFPNPAVLAAALATRTRRIRLNAGSVVLPLHHPVRVAEEWSMVDNLSGGRIGLGCAPGWHANDFVFFPEHYGRHKQVMYEHLATVRRLWRGESVTARAGDGEPTEVRLFPRPIQAAPPAFTAIVGNPESYREAARNDVGVVTNLMTQDVDQLAANIALYRRTRAEHGLDPAAGRVTVLLHTYLGDDLDRVRAEAFEPFHRYLRSSLGLLGQVTNSLGMNIDLAGTPDEDVRFVLSQAYGRYCAERALIGTPQSCREVVAAVLDAGVDEIACFVDFGLPADAVRAGLPFIDTVRRTTARRHQPAAASPPGPSEAAAAVSPDTAPEEVAPLSAAQRRLWITAQLDPTSPAYNEAVAVRLAGPLDVPALQGALQDVVDRHAPLRTVYREIDGVPHQVVRATVPVECPVRDLDPTARHGHEDEAVRHGHEDEAVRAVMAAESRRRFDLTAGPVFAFTLLRFAPTRHVLVLSFHHLATDGGSYAILTREVSECYRARVDGRAPDLPRLTTSYPQLAGDDGGGRDREKALRYWLRQLDPPPPALVLPSDLPRPAVPSAAGSSLFRQLPAGLTRRVEQFSRTERVTAFTTLLSAFGVVLSRFGGGQDDLVVGTGMSSRDDRSADLVGFFVDTVPLRLDLRGDPTFQELVARVQLTAADGYEHADLPFDELVEALAPVREPGRNPLFDVVVEYERGDAFRFDLPGVTAEPLPVGLDKAPVDLMVYLSHGATVDVHVEYRSEVLDRATVDRLVDHLHRFLDAATRDPQASVTVLTDRLDHPGGGLSGPVTPPTADRLHDLFLRRATVDPDAVAVVAGPDRWTYRELRERADGLARRVAAEGVGPDDVVGVLLPRRPELIAAQLGVLMAGAAFLPLDPYTPPARLAGLLADSGARLVVTATGIATPAGVTRLLVDETGPAGLPAPTAVPGPDHLAWCVYTSGSTGRPKGVAVSHRAAVNAVTWHVGTLGLTGTDVVGHLLGLGFDANLAEIHPALAAGATVALVPADRRADPARLTAWWSAQGVTVALVPAPLAELVFALPARPAGLPRTLMVGGSQLRRRPPVDFPATVVNAYGPTENAIVSTAGRVPPDGTEPVHIGGPVDNVRLYVLDGRGRPVPPGAVGELHLAGRSLARGYLGRPAETAAAFRPEPFSGEPGALMYATGDRVRLRGDGTVEFLGRTDEQVKIAGHRVEPGEAAAELVRLAGVRQATVVARQDRGPEPYLTAYVVPVDGAEPAAALRTRLTGELTARLPGYLVPRAWVFLDALPVGETGKVDPARLPAPEPDGGDRVPQPGLERVVHDAWCAELGVDRVPLEEGFFATGGHSLGAVRLANRLTELLGTEVGVDRVLRAAGVRALAASLAGDPTAGPTVVPAAGPTVAPAVVPAGEAPTRAPADGAPAVEEVAPASHQQETMWNRQHVAPNPAAVHMAVRINLTGRLDVPALGTAVDGLVARHGALRTRLVPQDGQLRQEVLAHRPVPLPVVDLDHAPEDPEVERWCVATGREPFDDDGPKLRARLARLPGDHWILMLVVHHLHGDGWSMFRLFDEFGRRYAAALDGTEPVLEPVPVSYPGYARRQRAEPVSADLLDHWRRRLAGAPRTVPLPVDRPGADLSSGRGAEYVFPIPDPVTAGLTRLAGELGTTMFPVLAAGYALLVAELTGDPDVVLAGPYAHRDSRDIEPTVGLFTSPLVLRLPVAEARTFADLVRVTEAVFLDAVRHQPAPLAEVYAAVDPQWRQGMPPPVATALLGWNPGLPPLRLPGLVAELVDQPLDCARREYATVLTPTPEGLRGTVEYSTDRLDQATVARWCDRYVEILAEGAAAPTALPAVPQVAPQVVPPAADPQVGSQVGPAVEPQVAPPAAEPQVGPAVAPPAAEPWFGAP